MWYPAAVLLFALMQTPDYSAEGLKALDGGNYAAAVEQLSKAVAADPKDYAAHFNLALANSLLGKDSEAIAGYRTVLELKPGLYQAELNLGIVLIRAKQAREAIPLLEAAVQEKPKELQPNLQLAEALLAAGELARAEQYYRASADLDPSLKDALLKVAVAYERGGQAPQAIEIYTQFPENVAARERMGELLIEAGKPAEAAPQLEFAVGKSPTSANRVALATAYLRTNQAEKAVEQLQQAVEGEPRNFELRMKYGRVVRDLKKYPAAGAEFMRATELKPDSIEAWNELASMLILLEDFPRALAALDRVRQLGGEMPGHFFLRAIMLDKMKQLKPALDNYRKFLTLANGKYPDEEFKARQRARILEGELGKK
jgi:tetratricopeptide (TPR) repeat protein